MCGRVGGQSEQSQDLRPCFFVWCTSHKGVACLGWNFTSCISQVSHLRSCRRFPSFFVAIEQVATDKLRVSELWHREIKTREAFVESLSWIHSRKSEFNRVLKKRRLVLEICGLTSPGRKLLFQIIIITDLFFTLFRLYFLHRWSIVFMLAWRLF